MNKVEVLCRNMNHSKANAPVQYCPQCGKTVNRHARNGCDNTKHMALRKQGDHYCIHCGKDLQS